MVFETCEDFTQSLGLQVARDLPPDGILTWSADCRGERARVFSTRKEARAAIKRTEAFRRAWGVFSRLGVLPEAKDCIIQPVEGA